MSRSSEIDRCELGDMVMGMYKTGGETATTIAAAITKESGHTFSAAQVYRYTNKYEEDEQNPSPVAPMDITPAIAGSPEHHALELLAAAIKGSPDVRDTDNSDLIYFGRYAINVKNPFNRYYRVARDISGQVERGFMNLALKVTHSAKIVGDENDVEQIDTLMDDMDFSSLLQDTVRSTCELGTCVVLLKTIEGEYAPHPQILPMAYLSLLTDKETPGAIETGKMIHGQVTQIVHDEGGDNQHVYKRDDVGLFRIWAGSNYFTDIKNRITWSIYGRSMTIGVETPLKSLLNSSYYYDEFIKRYGLGRLYVNMKLLADLVLEKKITLTEAQQYQEDEAEVFQKIGANEDIITTGKDISMIESKTGFDIVPYLEWREKQIDRALLQSAVASGDVGSAWTNSGGTTSSQEMDALESLRKTLFDTFMTEVVTPYALNAGLDPTTLSVSAEPLSQVIVPMRDLIELQDRGIISERELRTRAGFLYDKPEL